MNGLRSQILADLERVVSQLDEAAIGRAVESIASARRIALYGVGREGLQMKGLAMRLFHLGLEAAAVGDMTAPYVGEGDLLVVSAGDRQFSTVLALMGEARSAGARTLAVISDRDSTAAKQADVALELRTRAVGYRSSLPMGSLYEAAQFILFEIIVLSLMDRLNCDEAAMRQRHTNLE